MVRRVAEQPAQVHLLNVPEPSRRRPGSAGLGHSPEGETNCFEQGHDNTPAETLAFILPSPLVRLLKKPPVSLWLIIVDALSAAGHCWA
jgi:hypothetical protein